MKMLWNVVTENEEAMTLLVSKFKDMAPSSKSQGGLTTTKWN